MTLDEMIESAEYRLNLAKKMGEANDTTSEWKQLFIATAWVMCREICERLERIENDR